MMIVIIFLEKLENFAYFNNTSVKKKSNYHGFFFLKIALQAAKRGTVLDFKGQIQVYI